MVAKFSLDTRVQHGRSICTTNIRTTSERSDVPDQPADGCTNIRTASQHANSTYRIWRSSGSKHPPTHGASRPPASGTSLATHYGSVHVPIGWPCDAAARSPGAAEYAANGVPLGTNPQCASQLFSTTDLCNFVTGATTGPRRERTHIVRWRNGTLGPGRFELEKPTWVGRRSGALTCIAGVVENLLKCLGNVDQIVHDRSINLNVAKTS
jgi:hypothetical protein